MDKHSIHLEAEKSLQKKINDLKGLLKETQQSTAQDSKSSAGDKHETATSMAQLEQEKLVKQINTFLEMSTVLKNIQTDKVHLKIDTGSLIETNLGWYYFSVPIGKIECNHSTIFCLSIHSPIGKLLKGKITNESITFNNNKTTVLQVY